MSFDPAHAVTYIRDGLAALHKRFTSGEGVVKSLVVKEITAIADFVRHLPDDEGMVGVKNAWMAAKDETDKALAFANAAAAGFKADAEKAKAEAFTLRTMLDRALTELESLKNATTAVFTAPPDTPVVLVPPGETTSAPSDPATQGTTGGTSAPVTTNPT